MAAIRERVGKTGITYHVQVRIKGQATQTKTFNNKKDAQAWADSMSTVIRESATEVPNVKKFRALTLHKILDDYAESLIASKSYVRVIPTAKKLIDSRTTVGGITSSYAEQYVVKARKFITQYGKKLSDSSILKHLGLLRVAIRYASKKYNCDFNIKLLTHKDIPGEWEVERSRVLTEEEEGRIRVVMSKRTYAEHLSLLLDLAIETGAREAELVNLPFSEINLQLRVWTLPKARTKSKKDRLVPLSLNATQAVTRLMQLLKAHNDQRLAKGLVPETRLFYVFKNPSSVGTNFAHIVKAAYVDDFRFHDLRHTAVTRMVLHKRELSIYEIMKIVGHTSIEMLNRYANLRPEDLLSRLN